MPVHDLGYRPWNGQRTAQLLRPLVVARGGISLVWRRRWLRTVLALAWLPMMFPALAIFAFEYSSTDPDMRGLIAAMLRGPLNGRPGLAEDILLNPAGVRHEVWSTVILFFFRYPQLSSMVLLVGLIAPMLVSYDLRSKAYLMYFSRPLTPMEYLIGKSAVLWFFLGMIATVPALFLYGVGILLSPDLSVVMATWDIPLRILGASAVLMIPTTALAMFYSSFTSESRYASFSWFATWAMGYVAYQILTFASVRMPPDERGPRGRRFEGPPPTWEEMGVDFERWRWVSPYHALGKVQAWIFDLDHSGTSVLPTALMLLFVVVGCTWVVRRRIVARLSV